MLELNTIKIMDCMEGLKTLPDNCVQCCITSPPYWNQRDYGRKGQYGLEDTPELYVERLTHLFEEIKRVLKDDGTLWLNLGDAYWGSRKAGNNADYQKRHTEFGKITSRHRTLGKPTFGKHPVYKHKDLMGLPWKVAFALQKQGWFFRQDIIWHKPNAMPESVKDRCTRTHEFIFMLSKSSSYYYNADAIKTDLKTGSSVKTEQGRSNHHKYLAGAPGSRSHSMHQQKERKQDGYGSRHAGFNEHWDKTIANNAYHTKANRRSVWEISCKPFRGNHFATFPLDIPQLCIRAGSRENDVVLDPFMGAGTTALAAALLNRSYIGFELNSDYVALAKRRLRQQMGMFDKG